MRSNGVVVVGSSNTDMVIRVKHLPRAGETVLGGEFMTAAGGKGANQAVAAARAGARVSFVACLGRDSLGDRALAGFIENGIEVSHVTRTADAASGAALIFVSRHGENSIAVASGANDRLSPTHVRRARLAMLRARVLLVQLETPRATVEAAVRLAVKQGMLVILNPAPARLLPNRLLRLVSILTPNEAEAESLTGIKIEDQTDAMRAAKALRSRGIPTVIITMGAQGALVSHGTDTELVGSFKVRTVDTTAAGDVFNGALAAALTKGRRLHDAVRFANAAAALSVTSMGAQPSAPMLPAIERFIATRSKPRRVGRLSGHGM